MPTNGWNKLEQGWNGIGDIRINHSDHFATPLMAIFGSGGPKMGQTGSILLLLGPNGLWCQKMVGTRWNKLGTG